MLDAKIVNELNSVKYPKVFLGKHEGEAIYLSAPTFDCNWYWGFGYIGNRNCHYHLDSLNQGTNYYDGIKKHFGDSFVLKNERLIWQFCEIVKTIYTLRETAEVFYRGGSHLTLNPCQELIKSPDIYTKINVELIPALIKELYALFDKQKEENQK